MKILLDENIDVRFKRSFSPEHKVYTISDMKWNGIKNGALLKLLKENQFDCWIVVDKNIPYQQNISILPCPIIVLDVFRNTLKNIDSLMPSISAVLNGIMKNEIIVVSE